MASGMASGLANPSAPEPQYQVVSPMADFVVKVRG
jgi:hypothetical protein